MNSLHAHSEQLHQVMNQWFDSPLGRRVLATERRLLKGILARRFGYHLLELGCADLRMGQSSPIGHKFSFAPHPVGRCHQAAAQADAIPLSSDSVDLVLLHHALDYAENQHQLLREAARIVIAGGHLVIVGFNPYSTWGLRHRLSRGGRLPWHNGLLSPLRLTDWLKLLDFQVEHLRFGLYVLPFNSPRLIRYSSFLEGPASRLNWPTGGIYIITALKQVAPVTPVHPHWRRFPVSAGLPVTEKVGSPSRRDPASR